MLRFDDNIIICLMIFNVVGMHIHLGRREKGSRDNMQDMESAGVQDNGASMKWLVWNGDWGDR